MGHLLVYGLLFFVPMAPVAVFGIVVNRSGGVPVLVYLVAAAIMALSAISYAQMARRFPVAGSVYGYTRLSTNRFLGFVAGWLILLDYILMPALLTILSAVALGHIWPIPPAVYAAVFVGASVLMNLRGMKITTRVGLVLLAIQLVVIALFVGFVLQAAAAGQITLTLHSLWRPEVSWAAVLSAVSIAALSFLGFDAVNTLNEEARGGGKAVSRATTMLLGLITVLFCLQLWAAAVVSDATGFAPGAATNRAFYGAVDAVAPGWYVPVFTLTNAFVAIFACLVVAHAASSRLLFAMARDGVLPRQLARTSSRGVPHVAVLTIGAIALVVSVVFAEQAELMTSLVTFGALSSYVLLHLAVLARCLGTERSTRWLTHLVVPVAGIATLLLALSRSTQITITVGLSWLVLGIAGHLLWSRIKPSSPAQLPDKELT
ncbi:APC family permease [Enemella sp. A6]|uniref:APC family permease n=1 Tax=Enemella sp. A6 TaxID=3440152 RepID=UPI003EBDB03F